MTQTTKNNPFPSTHWSIIFEARTDPESLNTILATYWRPIYGYLCRRGHSTHDAADLTQAFMTEVMLNRNIIDRSDIERGSFRAFLKTALHHFEIDTARRANTIERGKGQSFVPSNSSELETAATRQHEEPTSAFDRLWAITIINQVVENMEQHLKKQELDGHLEIFKKRILFPALHGANPVPIAQLMNELDIEDPTQISHMQHALKKRFRSTLRRIIAKTVNDKSQIDEELNNLLDTLKP